jgi:hypothetical protein
MDGGLNDWSIAIECKADLNINPEAQNRFVPPGRPRNIV